MKVEPPHYIRIDYLPFGEEALTLKYRVMYCSYVPLKFRFNFGGKIFQEPELNLAATAALQSAAGHSLTLLL